MKSFNVLIAIVTLTALGSIQQASAAPTTNYGQVDEWEYGILKENCRMIIYRIEEYLAGYGALNSSATKQAFKPEISNYLLSRGTPAARKLYAAYEAIGWKYPDIRNI